MFGWTINEVRAHTQRDLWAYGDVLKAEQRRKRMRASAAKAAKGRKR